MHLRNSILAAAAGLTIAPGLFAAGPGSTAAPGSHLHPTAAAAPSQDPTLTSGQVRKVDLAQAKITIQHEAIANLGMPGMTMVFRAEPPSLLKAVKAGDAIRFHAESQGGALVVTQIVARK